MSNFRTFKDLFHFKEVVCLIAIGYIALIFIIIVLSIAKPDDQSSTKRNNQKTNGFIHS